MTSFVTNNIADFDFSYGPSITNTESNGSPFIKLLMDCNFRLVTNKHERQQTCICLMLLLKAS